MRGIIRRRRKEKRRRRRRKWIKRRRRRKWFKRCMGSKNATTKTKIKRKKDDKNMGLRGREGAEGE